jgi:hypothetical protein
MHEIEARKIAETLVRMYDCEFGGKVRGRFRVSMKHMRKLAGRRRVHEELLRQIADQLYELGFVLIDLETYFVVVSQTTFRGYRRVNDAIINDIEFGCREQSKKQAGMDD